MTRILVPVAALVGLLVTAPPAWAFHPFKHHCAPYGYAKVPLAPAFGAPMGFATGGAFGYSAPFATGFGFSAPLTTGFSFGVLPSQGFGFGVTPGLAFGSGFSLVPNAGLSYGFGGVPFGADAQGVFDQFILQMLLQRLGGGGGGGQTLRLTDKEIQNLADQVVTKMRIKPTQDSVDNIEKILRALVRQKFPEVRVPDAVPPIPEGQSLLPPPVDDSARPGFAAVATESRAIYVAARPPQVGPPPASVTARPAADGFAAVAAAARARKAAEATTPATTAVSAVANR